MAVGCARNFLKLAVGLIAEKLDWLKPNSSETAVISVC